MDTTEQAADALPPDTAGQHADGPGAGHGHAPPPSLELLVHGVGGTTPQAMLDQPNVVRLSGDDTAGIYRRPADVDAEDHPEDHRGRPVEEAYCWSGLTSGNGSRALWLLLLPFMVVNLVHWMRPAGRPESGEEGDRSRGDAGYDVLVRVLALSLTVLFAAGACEVAMDLLAWQCAGSAGCTSGKSWLGFLSAERAGWWSPPGRRIAVAAVLPAALIALLWWLSHRTWSAYESQLPAGANPPGRTQGAPALALRGFWYGRRLVARLRATHTAAAMLTISTALLLPALREDRQTGGWLRLVGWILAVLVAAGAVEAVWVTCRQGRSEKDMDSATDRLAVRALPAVSIGLLVLSALYAGWSRHGWTSAGRLPGADTFGVVTLIQGVLIVALAVTVWRMRVAGSAGSGNAAGNGVGTGDGAGEASTAAGGTGDEPAPGDLPGDPCDAGADRSRVVAGGYGGPLVAVLACGLGGVFAGGIAQRVADWLDRGGTPGSHGSVLAGPPVLLSWQAAAIPVMLLILAIVALCGAAWLWRAQRREEAAVRASHPGQPEDPSRTRLIAGAIARAGLTDLSPVLVTTIAGGAFVLGAVAMAGAWGSGRSPVPAAAGLPQAIADAADTSQALGSWLLGAAAVALITLGRRAYRNVSARRTVGILWDVGTFWPRAAHPFAPPCYAERAVPDLTWRIATWTQATGGRLVLSAHSQGTVLAAAAVWQLPPDTRRRIALLTYGSPLERLYGRYFPAYFGPPALETLHRELHAWRNLWRRTDPIGGRIRLAGAVGRAVDVGPLPDPAAYSRDARHPLPSPVLAHSDYQEDPAFAAERAALLARIPDQDQGISGRSSG